MTFLKWHFRNDDLGAAASAIRHAPLLEWREHQSYIKAFLRLFNFAVENKFY